jgi:Ulp1 family protease
VLQTRFLVVPIHERNHWSVLVVCNLRTLLARLKGEPGSARLPKPFILHLDSLHSEMRGWPLPAALALCLQAYMHKF